MIEQDGHAEHLQGGQPHQGHLAAVTHSLGHGHTDAQAGIASGTLAHGNGVQGDGMAFGKRKRLFHIHSTRNGMAGTLKVFAAENDLAVLTQGHGTHPCTGINMQYARHKIVFSF